MQRVEGLVVLGPARLSSLQGAPKDSQPRRSPAPSVRGDHLGTCLCQGRVDGPGPLSCLHGGGGFRVLRLFGAELMTSGVGGWPGYVLCGCRTASVSIAETAFIFILRPFISHRGDHVSQVPSGGPHQAWDWRQHRAGGSVYPPGACVPGWATEQGGDVVGRQGSWRKAFRRAVTGAPGFSPPSL